MKQWNLLVLLLIFTLLITSSDEQSPTTAHQQAIDYLQTALDFIQHHSLKNGEIDWKYIQQEDFISAKEAQTPAQTYPIIQWTLQQLGDHHSFFLGPEQARQATRGQGKGFGVMLAYDSSGPVAGLFVVAVYPGSPAARAGLQIGDQVQLINGMIARYNVYDALKASSISFSLLHRGQTTPFSVKLVAASYDTNLRPQARRLGNDIGYIELPALEGGSIMQQYADIVQQDITQLDQVGVRRWIVDLRLNEGGNMWPMLAGIGPVLGEGKEGAFIFPGSKAKETWYYHMGQALMDQTVIAQATAPYQLKQALPPVAVLTSPYTGSSGEAITVAFRARPHTQSFGEPTAGVPTANIGTTLSDGSVLVVTEAMDADRTDATYDSSINPTQTIHMAWGQFGTTDDPTIQAATTWLQTQAA